MERNINYKWWLDDDNEISEENIERLDEQALDRINEMVKEGCHSGELISYIVENGKEIDVSGWWDVSKVE